MNPVPFTPDMETIEPNEAQTTRELCRALRSIMETTARDTGHGLRAVHAKSHALLQGRFSVLPDLPPELAQGLFATRADYAAVVRLSTIPGDLLDDRVSVPRGVAIKVIGVEGERLAGSDGDRTQDFVLVDAPAFSAPSAAKFLGNLKLLAKTTDKAEWAKIALSSVLRRVESGIEAIGMKSAILTTLGGHALTHPLGESYFSQTAFLYGPYAAKFALIPTSPNLTALSGAEIDLAGRRDGLREEIAKVIASHPSTWEFRVQLMTEREAMPIEDASVPWPEDQSPYRTVATLTVNPQPAWSEARVHLIDEALSFSVWHGLSAHRPLGAINRVRKPAYEMSARHRSRVNGCPIHEPARRLSIPESV